MMKDVVNFMVHDRRALNSNILRFDARILTNFAPDKERKFILVYYRTNDTFEIHETKINNSGAYIILLYKIYYYYILLYNIIILYYYYIILLYYIIIIYYYIILLYYIIIIYY